MAVRESAVPALVNPLAITGIGCRLPGGVNNVESLWSLLTEGRSGICEVPANRWNLERFYHPDVAVPGTMTTKWGGFLSNLEEFDAQFWGISPREAMRMDPQQRWLLEVSWEALEDAGVPPCSLAGKPVGVFIGISGNDYGGVQLPNHLQADMHTVSGCTLSIASNRISYLLNLRGPSLSVDTACSSALVAIWNACQSIWSGCCESALAGGVNAIIIPDATIGFSKASMLSPTGQCFAFDSRANGYVRGEGAGVLYIKPLERAQADKDRIYAVIRAAATNQDGHTSSMAVPSVDAQARLLEEACRQAGTSPREVVYVEAHGTGTPVGDPIEASALGRVLGKGRPADHPCLIGSIKTNIGHLEAASGAAGLIKAALALHHDTIPPSRNYEQPNPNIPFDQLGLRVAERLQPLPHVNGHSPLVGVNSFGFGGANAHVILEQARRLEAPESAPRPARPYLLPISARDEVSLRAAVESYRAFLARSEDDLADICYTAGARREHHEHRLAIVGVDPAQMRQRLSGWLCSSEPVDGVTVGRAANPRPAPVFVYTGQGVQWWAMGRQLLERELIFRETVHEIDGLLRPVAGWSVWEELSRDENESNIHRTDIAQPAIFALQVALTRLWQSWGVQPAKVIGHSVGEVAAAYVAGCYSLADAVKIIVERSRLQHTTQGAGRMVAVGIPADKARRVIGGDADRVQIAVLNGPNLVTLAGDSEPLERIARCLEQEGCFVSWLRIAYAFHTHQMDPIENELRSSLADLRPRPAAIPFISTVTGGELNGVSLSAEYWWRNVRQPVQFAPAIAQLIQEGADTFLEVGAHPALEGSIGECFAQAGRAGIAAHSLRRGSDESQELLGNLAKLHVSGVVVDWARVSHGKNQLVSLPHYPWQRQRFWLEAKDSQERRIGRLPHPLLGLRVAGPHPTWQFDLHARRFPYLNDHRFWDGVVFPGAAYAEIGAAIAAELFPDAPHDVEDLVFKKVLFIREEQPLAVQVVFDPELLSFSVYSSIDDKETWEWHAEGRLMRTAPAHRPQINLEALRARLTDHLDHAMYYRDMADSGYQFGPNFKQLRNVWRVPGEALAEIQVPEEIASDRSRYRFHPAVLDACLHLFRALDPALTVEDFLLPQSVRSVRIRCPQMPPHFWTHGRLVSKDSRRMISDINVYDDDGRLLAQILGCCLERVDRARPAEQLDDCYYQFRWERRRLRGIRLPGGCQFPGTASVISAGRDSIEDIYREHELKQYHQDFVPCVDGLSSQAVGNAWLELGWKPRVGDRFSSDEIIERLGIVTRYARLARAQLCDFSRAGYLRTVAAEEWEVLQIPLYKDTTRGWETLAEQYPRFASEVVLHQRTAPYLAAVLSGRTDARKLLFPGGSTQWVEQFYAEAGDFPARGRLIGQALSRLLQELPAQRVLRVLEIGAGTGSLTRQVLPHLPSDQTEYLFTDLGPTFVTAAKKQFADLPFVEYQVLDIERSFAEQGLPPGSFDLILGALVLHATDDLKRVLANLRAGLAPGGFLVFSEVFPRRSVWNNVFGLLEGWWRFTDSDLRQHSPLLERQQWHDLLRESGFADIGSFGTSVDERQSEIAFLCAFASDEEPHHPEEGPGATVDTVSGCCVLLADEGGILEALGERLEQRGCRAVRVRQGAEFQRTDEDSFVVAPDSEIDLRRVFKEVGIPTNELVGVVHGWSLDHPAANDALDLETLWAAQQSGVLAAWRLTRTLAESIPSRFWFVTRDAGRVLNDDRATGLASSPLTGLLRVANNEFFPSRFSLVDLDASPGKDESERLFEEVTAPDGELEVAYRKGQRHVIRLRRVEPDRLPVRTRNACRDDGTLVPYRLETKRPGILNNLRLNETPRRDPGPHEVELRVKAGGINFRDVLKALGAHPGNPVDILWFGDDVAGTIERVGSQVHGLRRGDAVVGMAPYGFQAYASVDERMLFRKPRHLTWEEAATIPTVFLTAHYALIHLARMQAGERILIHAGTGGVGQAAIQIARYLGLEIFATAGTPEKRQLLLELGAHHALDSRTLAFADEIRKITQARGVDAVLNSLAGDFISKSLSILAPYGRFLEIGKVDIYKNSKIGLEALRNNNSYFVIDLVQHGQTRPDFVASLLREIQERFEAGDYQPLQHTDFPISQVVEAFRYMAQGKHVGKNVLSFEVPEISIGLCTQPPHRFRPDATYLITGGASGIGMELAKWLSQHGARHIALCSRSGPRDDSVREDIQRMRSAGVHVSDWRVDVTQHSDVRRVITRIQQEGPPLKGVIHGAMVLDDDFMIALDEPRFTAVMRPKILGAWNLHQATADAELEHFICLSSFSGIVGAIKQSNYSVANQFLDTLAHYRRARGLPALTISWGGLLGAGFVERNRKTAEFMTNAGFKAFSLNEALDTFSRLTLTDAVHIGAARIDWRTFPKVCPNLARANAFACLTQVDGGNEQGGSLLARLQQTSSAERPRVLEDFIAAQVAGVFGLAADKIGRDVPLTRLGLDSLMALELTIRLEREIGTKIPMSNLLGGRTINGLVEPILRLLNQTAVPERPDDAAGAIEAASAQVTFQSSEDSYFQVISADAAQEAIAGLRFEGAALLYLPDKLVTVGGFNDAELAVLFGDSPFISHFYESALGRIAIITLPVRSHALSDPQEVRTSLVSAVELAMRHGVRCVSLTGLIPSLTHYGQDLAAWLRATAGCPTVTTGHATTSAAVIHNLQQMLTRVGRPLAEETLAVLGLGSIGQSCLQLLLELGPHPRELVLCDVFAKEQEWRSFADALREEHGYRGSIRTATSHAGVPAAVYEASTILTAVSVPDVLDVSQLRPGTVIVDDSYPPAFPVESAMRRMQAQGDIFFSNAGMLRLPQPIKETLLVPANLAGELKRFGVAAFREEAIRDPFELTGCVLSSLLTARTEGDFTPTLGMAGLQDLLSHYHALTALGIRAARPQCDRYFIPEEAIEQFHQRFGQPAVIAGDPSAQPASRCSTPSMTVPVGSRDRC